MYGERQGCVVDVDTSLHFISLHLTSFIHIRLPLEDQSPLTKQSKTTQSITVWGGGEEKEKEGRKAQEKNNDRRNNNISR